VEEGTGEQGVAATPASVGPGQESMEGTSHGVTYHWAQLWTRSWTGESGCQPHGICSAEGVASFAM
jgi:hypothetical protein